MTVKRYIASDEREKHELREPDDAMPYDAEIELSDEEWADFQRVSAEYEAWQERLEAAIPPMTQEDIDAGREWHRKQERERWDKDDELRRLKEGG